jgi:non-homologous end joining protein Ku
MAPRANWKGFLRLSLVTCPVCTENLSSGVAVVKSAQDGA